jgi:hypothetical protein
MQELKEEENKYKNNRTFTLLLEYEKLVSSETLAPFYKNTRLQSRHYFSYVLTAVRTKNVMNHKYFNRKGSYHILHNITLTNFTSRKSTNSLL